MQITTSQKYQNETSQVFQTLGPLVCGMQFYSKYDCYQELN